MASSRPVKTVRVELGVKVNNQVDISKIESALKAKAISIAYSNVADKTIELDLNLQRNLNNTSTDGEDTLGSIQGFIEKETGFVTVIKGVGTLGSAVAELGPPVTSRVDDNKTKASLPIGVVRISQIDNQLCYVDGRIDRLGVGVNNDKLFSAAVHEYGDLDGPEFESLGDPMITLKDKCLPQSDHLDIKKVINNCNVASLIGRSVALTEYADDTGKHQVISAGVIARASTVGANKKQVCSCSGKTLWEERLEKKKDESPN